MSNIIGFLENIGRNSVMRHANRAQLLRAMQREEIETAAQTALLQAQRSTLNALLGARETMYCKNQSSVPPTKKAPAKKKPTKKAPAKKAPSKGKR